MEPIPRLDPANIKDALVRRDFYMELRTSPERDQWDSWEISADEAHRPDLVAYRYYGTASPKRVVAISAGLDDLRGQMRIGSKVPLPPASWIRSRIRHYMEVSDGIK